MLTGRSLAERHAERVAEIPAPPAPHTVPMCSRSVDPMSGSAALKKKSLAHSLTQYTREAPCPPMEARRDDVLPASPSARATADLYFHAVPLSLGSRSLHRAPLPLSSQGSQRLSTTLKGSQWAAGVTLALPWRGGSSSTQRQVESSGRSARRQRRQWFRRRIPLAL